MTSLRYVLLLLSPSLLFADGSLLPVNVTVGQNLEATAKVVLNGPAPASDLPVTLESHDPSQLLLSHSPDAAGSASITLTIRKGGRSTPDFYVQGIGNSGSVAYTATASGFSSADGTVTLVPSAFVVSGPYGIGKSNFRTTIRSGNSKISILSVAIDSSQNGTPQPVAGGRSVKVNVVSSDASVGAVLASPLVIAGGQIAATSEFQPLSAGRTTLAASLPGVTPPPGFGAVTAIVTLPGIGLTGDMYIGRDLQAAGSVGLGAAAPAGGLKVKLTSADPKRLLLSPEATEEGAESITVTIPAGTVGVRFYLQALGDSGVVSYTACAPGYTEKTATVKLSPSGVVVIGPLTLPEGQLLRSVSDGGPKQHGFLASLSGNRVTPLNVDTVQLDPVSHRAADITIQPLRAGLTLKVDVTSSNPAVGTVISPVVIKGGSEFTMSRFNALSTGQTTISVATPAGFTTSSNDSTLNVIVRP